jgi:hypothetical protein
MTQVLPTVQDALLQCFHQFSPLRSTVGLVYHIQAQLASMDGGRCWSLLKISALPID